MKLYLALLVFTQIISTVFCYNGVLYYKGQSDTDWDDNPHFCLYFNPNFNDLPTSRDKATPLNLTDMSGSFGCEPSAYTTAGRNVSGTAVLIARHNCSFSLKAKIAQSFGAKALIVVITHDQLLVPSPMNLSDYHEINITVGTIMGTSVSRMGLHNNYTKEVLMYSPDIAGKFNFSMILVFLISVSCVAVGGFWSGRFKHAKYHKLISPAKSVESLNSVESQPVCAGINRRAGVQREVSISAPAGQNKKKKEADDDTVDMSIPALLIFFVFTCGFIVLLYFFFDVMVYVLIGIFCLAAGTSLYACIWPFWSRLFPRWTARVPNNKIKCCGQEYRKLVLAFLCLSVGIFWGIQRHASYAWVFQDIIGYALCLNFMKTIRTPNLKVCTVLSILLFVYDIFFVFITPLITPKGDSVMVKVALGTGSKTHETVPMLFKVPMLTTNEINVCPMPYAMLGFGDVVIPGFLVAHNYAFDLLVGSRNVYFISTIVAYSVGVIMSYVGLSVMHTGQPVLMYLVPCTLITTFVIGCIRKEVKLLWRGIYQLKTEEVKRSEEIREQQNRSTESINSTGSVVNEDGPLLRN